MIQPKSRVIAAHLIAVQTNDVAARCVSDSAGNSYVMNMRSEAGDTWICVRPILRVGMRVTVDFTDDSSETLELRDALEGKHMSTMKVQSTIECYEVNGREPSIPVGKIGPQMQVESHWAKSNMVILRIGDQSYTVVGSQLEAAIKNALNRGGP